MVVLSHLCSKLGAMHLLKQFAFMKRKSVMEIKISGDVWEATQGDFENWVVAAKPRERYYLIS